MNRSRIAFAAVALLMAVSAPLAAHAQVADSGGSTNPQVAQYEEAVLGSLMDNVAMAQALAKVCLAQASRPEVLAFCQTAQTTAQQNATTVQGWLGTWYGNSGYTGQLSDEDNGLLAQLNANPDQFESLLLNGWIRANAEGLAIARNYLGRTCADGSKPSKDTSRGAHACDTNTNDNPALTGFAESYISTLSAQDGQLYTWTCSWYGTGCDAAAALPQPSSQVAGNVGGSNGNTTPQVAQYEESVLAGLLDKVAMLQALGQACLAQASRPDVLTLCQSAQTYAQQSATSLQGWMTTWYGNSGYTGQLSDDDNGLLAQLNANPDQFESLLLAAWVSADTQAISVASTYLNRTCADGSKPTKNTARGAHACDTNTNDNPTLTNFALSMVGTLTNEQADWQSWLCSIYGKGC